MTSVSAGTRLGPYEIVSRIGAGGMGEVWRAKDTRLDRSVAIKILPAQFAQNAQLKLRFEREARAISALSHPHICTLFDVGDDYLVMELLEGESLAERLARGPLPMSDVLRYGAEIADALDRAHRAGIIHRDLKPANVMITKSGAKLLDFGLAKATVMELAGGDAPTVQKDVTQEGTILGTYQYMSPEQLDGASADPRTDIFALGAVLYEMATGKRAFAGKTRTSIIAAIVSGQPQPISTLQPVTPPAFEHVVQKCLEKDADARWQSAHDIAEELRWIATDAQPAKAGTRRSSVVLSVTTALLALIAVAATALYVRERAKPEERVAFTIPPPPGFRLATQTISPDGRAVAMMVFADGKQSLWVRRLDEIAPKRLATFTGWAAQPMWSPDSASIAYHDGLQLKRVSATGGEPELIGEVGGYGIGGAWKDDGTILFTPHWKEGLFRIPVTGGKAVRVTTLQGRETVHAYPHFLSDGQRFVYLSRTVGAERNQIYAGALDGKTRKHIVEADSIVGLARGSLLYVKSSAMYATPFDEKTLRLSGAPVRIADGVAYSEGAATSEASVSRAGAFLYFPSAQQSGMREVGWYDRKGRLIETVLREFGILSVFLARDGRHAVVAKWNTATGASDIYTLDVTRKILTRVTTGFAANQIAIYSADGREVYFNSDRDGMFDLYAQSEDGSTPARLIAKSDLDKGVTALAPDGVSLLGFVHDPKRRRDIYLFPIRGGAPRLLIGTEADERHATVSPDGRWLSYISDRSGRFEVYVRRYPDGRSIQVSTEGGWDPQWTFDGREIIFNWERKVFAVPIHTDGDTLRPGAAVPLFELTKATDAFCVSPADDRFLLVTDPDPQPHHGAMHYVSGWK